MNSLGELIVYYSVRGFAAVVRWLPVSSALWLGRRLGTLVYYFNGKHRSQVYANLKVAFAKTKSAGQIKTIAKQLFQNYGQNLIELLRLPLMTPEKFKEYVKVEGQEHVSAALRQGKGVILLAMHFGSWEMANLLSTTLGHPYKVIVKPQKRFSRLDDLLNSYRACGGSVVLERGMGTREFIKSLQNNEIVGLVVDQGGKDGILVPFFDRQASMSVGAIRVGLKLGVPICFAIIIRENGPFHRLVIHQAMDLTNTGNVDEDVRANLNRVTRVMEEYIQAHPAEYTWFYKIWKYSKESVALILSDGKTGHLRQSQAVARCLEQALAERGIQCSTQMIEVRFKSRLAARCLTLLSLFVNDFIAQGRLGFLRWFLTGDSFSRLMTTKADFIVSCGSSIASLNYLVSNDQQAKSIVLLKPGLLNFAQFDLAVLPQHDAPANKTTAENVVVTRGAPNLVTADYLQEQSQSLLKKFSHLKSCHGFKIGLLLGGDTKKYSLTEGRVKIVINELKQVAEELNADLFISTSRRTSSRVENLLLRELKKYPRCPLLIIANRNNVSEAVGGILGLSDVVVVSGDSISMISEAASSGKKTVVFPLQSQLMLVRGRHKHQHFIEMLHAQGYILFSGANHLRQAVYDLAKNKIQTRKMDDFPAILEGVKKII